MKTIELLYINGSYKRMFQMLARQYRSMGYLDRAEKALRSARRWRS